MKIGKVFDNIGIKVICLLLAIVIWLYANKGLQLPRGSEQGGIVTFKAVPVQLTGLPQESWKPEPETISLAVRCSMVEITMDTLHAVVNLTPEDGTERRVVLTKENVELPEGMDFVRAEPDEIELVQ
jgi:hypothetical protein